MEPTKKPWQSKTVLAAAILGIFAVVHSLGFLPEVDVYLQGHQDMLLMGLSIIGMGLRLVSKDKISIS